MPAGNLQIWASSVPSGGEGTWGPNIEIAEDIENPDQYAIFKYPIPVKEQVTIELPKDADIIRAEDVDGFFYIWAIVNTDPKHPTEKVELELYKTGAKFKTHPKNLRYLGACKVFIQMELCLYVFKKVK